MSALKVKEGPRYAVFVRGWSEPVTALGTVAGCGHEFAAEVPPIFIDLPTCPECGGVSAVLGPLLVTE